MISIFRNNVKILDLEPLQSSNVLKAVMGEERIALAWEQSTYSELQLGDYVEYQGSRWVLNFLPTVKKTSSRNFRYDAVFQSSKYELAKTMYLLFDNTETRPRGEFSLTATPQEFMQLLVKNLNRTQSGAGWVLGEVFAPEEYRNLSFNNESCLDVLGRLAQEYETEYAIVGNIVHLKRFSTARQLTLEYGSTLYDIERASVNSSGVLTRLYPFGAARNLPANYRGGNSPLRIPEQNGDYIEQNTDIYGVIEAAKSFEDIYPRLGATGAGRVTEVGGSELEFFDAQLDFDVNACLLDGITAKLRFLSGDCAGYDFEIRSYRHDLHRFTLLHNREESGFVLPTQQLRPAVGDRYVLLDIAMPENYRQAAEEELLQRAQSWLVQNSYPKVAYKATFSAIYAKQNLQNVECGDTVRLLDAQLGIDEQIRITRLTRGISDFWTLQFDLANTLTKTTLERLAGGIANVQNEVVVTSDRINRKAFRAYQNARELRDMVFDPDGYFDTGHIKPLSIETSMLAVGARSQSFQLSCLLQPNYAGNPQTLWWTAGVLTHFSIRENTIENWVMPQGSTVIPDHLSDSSLFIYARCPRPGGAGDIYLDTEAIPFDIFPENWHFLIGVLHAPIDGVRGISLTYGQTTINGQFIRTGVIQSIDGGTYFNLNTGEIGGNIRFRSTDGSMKNIEEGIGDAINALEITGRNLLVGTNADYSGFSTLGGFSVVEKALYAVGNYYNAARSAYISVSETSKYTLSFEADVMDSNYRVEIENESGNGIYSYVIDGGLFSKTFNINAGQNFRVNFFGVSPSSSECRIRNIKLEKGSKATGWSPAPEDAPPSVKYLTDAIQKGATDIAGGLLLSSVIGARSVDGKVKTYISGMDNNPSAFAAGVENFGTAQEAKNIDLRHDGGAKIGVLEIDSLTGYVSVVDKIGRIERFLVTDKNIESIAEMKNASEISIDHNLQNIERSGTIIKGTYIESTDIPVTADGVKVTFTANVYFQSPGTSDYNVLISLYVLSDGQWRKYRQIGAARNVGATYDSNISYSISDVPAGNYRVGYEYSIRNNGLFRFTGCRLRIQSNPILQRVKFGSNGFYAYYAVSHKKNYMHMTKEKGLVVGGSTDMPGVLLAGSVGRAGGGAKIWGAKGSERPPYKFAVGRYTVYHEVGNTNYTVLITPIDTEKTFYLEEVSGNYFRVAFRNSATGQYADSQFHYVVIGEN